MDIHKPKPWRGWREFLKEFGVIVLGVLVALGAEQSVEWLHRQLEVREAREALHREMAHNLKVAGIWKREHTCWLAAADAAKAWAAGGGERPHYAPGLMQSYASSVWDMTRAGAVAHMPLDERLTLARFYDSIATDAAVINIHRSMVTEIGGFLERDRLNAEEAASLAKLASRLRWMSAVEFENAGEILEDGARLHVTAAPSDPNFDARVKAFCGALTPAR